MDISQMCNLKVSIHVCEIPSMCRKEPRGERAG